jgi:flagellar biosynthesis component FlhA
MKKGFLKIYDKVLIAGITAVFAFGGCSTKKNVSKNQTDKKEQSKEQSDENKTDSIDKVKKFEPGQVIAMYGIRQDQLK